MGETATRIPVTEAEMTAIRLAAGQYEQSADRYRRERMYGTAEEHERLGGALRGLVRKYMTATAEPTP